MKALSKPSNLMVLNLKRWPRELDRRVKAAAAMRDMTKHEFIRRAVEEFLKR